MIDVTCAIIRNDEDDILVVQRGEKSDHPLKWEFPGGKIDPGETAEESVIREISEELSMDIVISSNLEPVEYDYGKKVINLIPFICDTLDDLPLLSEHVAYRWIRTNDLLKVDFCEADLIVAERYMGSFSMSVDIHCKESDAIPPSEDESELQSMVSGIRSTKEADWLAESAVQSPLLLRKLLGYSFSGGNKLSFHASWILSKIVDRYPEIIYAYVDEIVDGLDRVENESTRRSLLRILSLTDPDKIDQKKHGILADYCFRALNSGFSAISIKAYSMEILYRLAIKYPELINEFSASVRMLQGENSAGIIARGRIVMKKLAGITKDPESSQI